HCRMVLARLHSRNRAKHHGFRGPAPALTVARGLLAPDCERLAGNSRVDADDLRVRTDVQYQPACVFAVDDHEVRGRVDSPRHETELPARLGDHDLLAMRV